MSFALSQRRTDRHPVGLVVVVGLHVVLAAALLSAKLQKGASEPAPVALVPIAPVKPVEPTRALPLPPKRELTVTVRTPDIVDPTPDPVIKAQPDDKATIKEQPTVIASLGGEDDTLHNPVRIQPRAARIDAGAAQCHPEYPGAAQRAGASGVTRIRFTVDAAGRIAGTQILRSSGSTREHRLMDQAAAAALARCPVQVGTDDQGRAVGTTTDVDYVWTLN